MPWLGFWLHSRGLWSVVPPQNQRAALLVAFLPRYNGETPVAEAGIEMGRDTAAQGHVGAGNDAGVSGEPLCVITSRYDTWKPICPKPAILDACA